MGAQEHKRSMLAEKDPEPDWSGLPDAMEKALHEVKQGRKERPAKLDANIPMMEAKNG